MASLSGILSLDDAFNMETTFSSLNPHKLELGDIEESRNKTFFPSYYQPILYGGVKLVLQTPAVDMSGLAYHTYLAGDAILIPISNWLRQQFNILDDFVRDTVVIPNALLEKWPYNNYSYKPICKDNPIYLIMNKSCCITQETQDDTTELLALTHPPLSEGQYSLTLEFDHVYIGWHRHKCLYSINFRVSHIHFKSLNATSDGCKSTHVKAASI